MIPAILSLIISFIPSLLLFRYLRNLRGQYPAYRSNCRSLLKNGVLCSIGVIALALAVNILWGLIGWGRDTPLLKETLRTFILAAFIEEFVKYKNCRQNNQKGS